MVKARDKHAKKKGGSGKAKKSALTEESLNRLRPVANDKELLRATKQAKTKAGQRHLDSLKPQVHEETKRLLLLKGHRTSERCVKLLNALALVRKPHVRYLSQRNQLRLIEPMDNPSDFEYLGVKNESSIFAMTSSTKKRPTRLFGGRLFRDKIYDLLEFDVLDFHPTRIMKGGAAPAEGSKPLVIFQGVCWEVSSDMQEAKNYFADLFGGFVADKVLLTGFDHAFICSAYESFSEALQKTEILIKINHYFLKLKRGSDSRLPDITLDDIGPTLLLRLGRAQLPDKNTLNAAFLLPAEEFERKNKNIQTNDLAESRAKLWVNKEDISKLHTPHAHSKKKAPQREMHTGDEAGVVDEND